MVVGGGFPAGRPGPAGVEVVRVVQEALANVRRHSEARHVVVTLGMVDGEVLVEVEDDGRGFGPETSYGMGLTGMRERVLALGGELEVEGRKGVGTRVFLRVRLGVLAGGGAGGRAGARIPRGRRAQNGLLFSCVGSQKRSAEGRDAANFDRGGPRFVPSDARVRLRSGARIRGGRPGGAP